MNEANLCIQDLIVQQLNPCKYVKEFCAHESEYLDFIGFYYCQIDQNVPIIVLATILVILFVFNFLGTTTDTYLAPTLETITEKLKLSEAIAGVTLLALANGATDVIAGLVAGSKESGGVSIAIGGLFGACLFCVTVVLARCVQGGGDIKVDAGGLKRDIFFLLLGVAYFFFLSIINEITWISSLGFFVIYLAFIIYVICIEKRKRTKTKNNWAMIREKLIYKDEEDFGAIEAKRKKIEAIYDQIVTFYLLKSIIVKRKNKGLKRGLSKKFTTEGLMESVMESVVSDDSRIIKENALNDEGEEDQDNSFFAKVMRIYNAPLFFIRNLTMPPFEKGKWNVYFAAATPIFGLLFLIWQVKLINQFNENKYLWIASGVVAGSLSLFIYCKGRKENLAETHGGKLAAISFIVSTLWLNLIAICFIDLLGLIKVLSGLPLGYLSLTLLAWGNSLADVFIDYVISKSGHGKMAVIGVYGGQLFNLFIGFGGSMLLQTLKRPVVLDIYVFHGELLKENILTLVLLASLVISLVATLFAGKWKNWVIGKNLMYFMLIFYLLFFLVVTLVTLFV